MAGLAPEAAHEASQPLLAGAPAQARAASHRSAAVRAAEAARAVQRAQAAQPAQEPPSSPNGLGRIRDEAPNEAPISRVRELKALAADPATVPLFPPGPPAASQDKPLGNLPLLPPPPPPAGAPGTLQQSDAYAHEEVPGLPGVTQRHIDEAFQEIDFDSNGFIGVSELRFLLCTMGERPNDEELDEMIRLLDSEGRGQVSRDEFSTLFALGCPVLSEMVSQAPPVEDPPAEEEEEKLSEAESDSSEKLRKLVKAIGGFMHASTAKHKKKERMKTLPQSKARGAVMSMSPVTSPKSSPKPLPSQLKRRLSRG